MKKFLAAFVVAVMLLTVAAPAIAAQSDPRLREAILLAKRHFPATDTFREFFTSQQTFDNRTIYYLQWQGSTKDPAGHNPSSLSVSVDLERLLITNFNHQEATPRGRAVNFAPLPKLSQADAARAAEALAVKLAPQQFALMRLFRVNAPTVRIGVRTWPHHYTFHYIQFVNNIPFPANSLSVTVNADSGEVVNYHLNHTEYEFPSPAGAISLARAEEVLKGIGLKLVYQQGFSWRQGESKPFLAYVLEDGRQLHIDAFTGEILKNIPVLPWPSGQDSKRDGNLAAQREAGLTPYEQKEIELVAGLMPLAEAEALARLMLNLPAEAVLQGSRLYLDTRTEQRLWTLNFRTQTNDKEGSASVTLDAANGQLESLFYHDQVADEDKPTMTRAAALEIARQFLSRYVSARYQSVVLISAHQPELGEVHHAHGFTWNREVNGIPVTNDNLFVSVRHDGRVTSFSSNWYRGEFVSPQGALTGAQMSQRFLADVGLELMYVVSQVEVKGRRQPATEIRLIYLPKELGSYFFDAFTGKNVDWQGQAVVPTVKPNYTDIAAHWAQADIKLLVDWGLLRLPGHEFRPDATMNLGDLLSLLATAAGWEDSIGIRPQWLSGVANERNVSALSFAAHNNLIREDEKIDPEALVTREMLAFYLARLTGHGETAAFEGIWAAPFTDFAQVLPKYQGSVAIVHALRLMAGSSGNFMPQGHTTRAQVAVILARMLRTK